METKKWRLYFNRDWRKYCNNTYNFRAHDLGIGSVVVRNFETENLKKLFNIPENMVPISLLPIGYPKEGVKPSKLHFTKNDIKDMVEYL